MAERAVGHAHVGDVGHVQPVRRLRLEPAFHEVGPAARAPRRFGGDGRPAAAHAADSQFPHDVHHLVAADLGRIPAPRQQPGVRLAVPVHGHEGIGMDLEDVAGQRLVPGGHAADGPGFEHAVAARRDEPAVQRSGQHPADRPDPETVLEFVDASDHQRRVGSSRAAKKADAVVNISFARLNRATSARKLFNSAIASSADCLVSAATVASVLLRQRRSVSGATPRSLATCSIALVSDEYEPRDSVNSLTAFALNSGVYLVPFAMVPSSPIELGKCGTKISSYQVVMESMTSPTKWHQPHILMYKVDTFVMGDDWKGKFDSLTDICTVVYLPRTPEISTTKIKHDLDIIHQDTQS